MATTALHISLRAGVAVIVATLTILLLSDGEGEAAAFAPETADVVPAPSATTTAPAETAATCPLRLPAGLPSRTRSVPILMYHRVRVARPWTPEITRRLTVHPAVFERQMQWLRRNGFHTITQRRLFEALMCGRPLPSKPILITFDDGYRDNFFNASPVIARLGMRATAYVVSGRISSGDRSFLTWEMLRKLEARGIEIGSHTVTHAGLTGLSDRQAFAELVRSRRALERRLGHRVPWLAYPFGSYDSRIERLARRAGYLLAVTTEWGTSQSAQRPLALPRLRILDSTGVAGLARMLAG